jgi:hypothetical protein
VEQPAGRLTLLERRAAVGWRRLALLRHPSRVWAGEVVSTPAGSAPLVRPFELGGAFGVLSPEELADRLVGDSKLTFGGASAGAFGAPL